MNLNEGLGNPWAGQIKENDFSIGITVGRASTVDSFGAVAEIGSIEI